MSSAKAKPDYSAFDAELLATIQSGVTNFALLASRFEARAKPFCAEAWNPQPFRVVDRRLQVLRKQNKIIYSTKAGWSLARKEA